MQKKISLILLSLFIFQCSFKANAEGPLNDIFIFSSEKDKTLIKPVIENTFNLSRHTPQEEFYFNLKWADITEISELNRRCNIIVVSLEFPADTTTDPFSKSLHANQNSANEHTLVMDDVYVNHQKFISLKTKDAIHLETILDTIGPWLVDQLFLNVNSQLLEKVNSGKKHEKLEQKIIEWFNLSIPVQIDYMILRSDTLQRNFLWLGRGVPYRWLTFHETPFLNSDKAEVYWQHFEKLVHKTMPQVEISSHYRTQDFLPDKNIKRLKGIYAQMDTHTGGPFSSYIFELPHQRKTLFITGYVNNPGKDKLMLLRKLELIISQTRFVNSEG